jgi:hypothetical protein
MSKNLFNHLEDLTSKKNTRWNELTEGDKKTFVPFLINRFISMEPQYIDKVNKLNSYTYSLEPKDVYNYYMVSLPKKKVFFRYIKKAAKDANSDLIDILKDYFKEKSDNISDYLNILPKEYVIGILQNMSYNPKEIKSLTKNL